MKENKISKVLEGISSGTKLYSTAFGNLELECVVEAFGDKRIKLREDNRDCVIYFPNGRYRKEGEITLYPSEEYTFVCVSSRWKYCIPYEGNEHLLGTNKNAEE